MAIEDATLVQLTERSHALSVCAAEWANMNELARC